jgi:D-alanyl-D-alanine carboxypeptidase (penicillin-binding protein 5/6)
LKRTAFPLLLALGMPLGAAGPVPQCKPVPAVVFDAPVVLLVDLSAGQTLYAHEAERRLLPASIVKAMSALVAFGLSQRASSRKML